MVVSGKLFAPPKYHKALRAELAAAYSGASVENVTYCPGDSALPAGVKNCPCDTAPLFLSSDGVFLFDANAIAYYLGNKQLRGGDEEFYVTQWTNFTDQVLMPSIAAWLYPIVGAVNYNKQQVTKGQENVKKALGHLNEFLAPRTYFVGEHITQADLTVFTALRMLYEKLMDEEARKPFPHVLRWYLTIANQPQVKKVVGEVQLCVKPLTFDPKNAAKAQKPKEEKKEQQKKKQEPPKKAEKPKAAEGDGEDDAPAKPSSNPLAKLPVGTFLYDDFKKFFSNNEVKESIAYFWDKFDPSTDSIWYCEYNYPEELKLTFMSANLIRGMFQRLEKMQKFSFAIMHVFGESNKSTIGGLWVWRGTDLIFDKSPDLQTDYESYTWTKLDPSAAETKARVADYFARGEKCDGKPVAETLVFK